jgi:Ca-activated chloride channel family protein
MAPAAHRLPAPEEALSFQWPEALAALAVLPLLAGLYVLGERRRARAGARFGNPALLPNVVGRGPGLRRHLPLAVLLVALAAMIVGVARPHATVSVRREQATVVLAIDVSRSMTAKDVRPTRLRAAEAAAKAFLGKVPEKFQVALVSFGSRAVIVVAPTADHSLVADGLDALRPGEGTALGDAIAISARLGHKVGTPEGQQPPSAVLMISDGAQQGGMTPPARAIRLARGNHVPVYTVLVGTAGGIVQAKIPGGFQATIRVPPNPSTLRMVAQRTGGQFFTATTDKGLRDVYERLGSRLGHRRTSREITDLFAGGSALLLLVGGGLSALWFRRVP